MMKEFYVVTERAGKNILILSSIGILLSVITVYSATSKQSLDIPLLCMALGIFITSSMSISYTRRTRFDLNNRCMTKQHAISNLVLCSSLKSYDELSTVHIRHEFTRSQFGGSDQNVVGGSGRSFWVVYVDTKGFGKKSRRFRIFKTFEQKEAQQIKAGITNAMSEN